jgi:hypothetical protein
MSNKSITEEMDGVELGAREPDLVCLSAVIGEGAVEEDRS